MSPADLARLLPPSRNGASLPQADLARAVAVAALAHAGQLDKSGLAYVLHPMRVMQSCQPHGTEVQIVAVLHDVVEDTWVTLAHLTELGFADAIVRAVDAISYRKGSEEYLEYIERCAANRLAALVKLSDLEDNLSPDRRFGANFDVLERRYQRAREIILARLADR